MTSVTTPKRRLIMADIHANRRAVEAINYVLDAYTNTITN